MRRIFITCSSIAFCAVLSACGHHGEIGNAQHWQRISASDAIYTRGPKAQQMLNRDLASCVAELRELVRLGSLRQSTAKDIVNPKNPDEAELARWDTPKRDNYLRAEHGDYHDLDGCMHDKGWDRVKYVPYDVAKESKDNYYKAHVDYDYQSRKRQSGDMSSQSSTEDTAYND